MKLTPLDIRRNVFSRAFRGYEREEVESFLAMVADEVEELIGEHRETTRRLQDLEREVEEFRKLERTLSDTLVASQKTSDTLKETSQREAAVIKREAQVRSEQTLDGARIEAERLVMEARRRAHATLEEASASAHDALNAARRQSEEMHRTSREEVVAMQHQVQDLIGRRDAFLTSLRAYLQGQSDALDILGSADTPDVGSPPPNEPATAEDEAEALAALDRELAEFASVTAGGSTETSSSDQAVAQPEETTVEAEMNDKPIDDGVATSASGPSSGADDGEEILLDGGNKPS